MIPVKAIERSTDTNRLAIQIRVSYLDTHKYVSRCTKNVSNTITVNPRQRHGVAAPKKKKKGYSRMVAIVLYQRIWKRKCAI